MALSPSLAAELRGHVQRKSSEDYIVCPRRSSRADCLLGCRQRVGPTLDRFGLERRRVYQTLHNAAGLRLVAGENPLVISRLPGHS